MSSNFLMFNGIPIYKSSELFIKYDIPKRHNKKWRIQKKWNKRYGFHTLRKPDPSIYLTSGCIIGHSDTIDKISGLIKTRSLITIDRSCGTCKTGEENCL